MEGNAEMGGQEVQLSEEFAALQQELLGGQQSLEQPQLPEKIGELGREDFEKLLEEASGGTIKNFNDFKEVTNYRSERTELQNKLKEYEQISKLNEGGPKFANELVQKLNDFYSNGVPEEQIYEFLRVQKMNVEELADMDVLRMKYNKEYPGLTDDDFEKLIDAEFGDLEGIGGLKMKKAAMVGRKELAELKVSLSEPEHLRMQKTVQEQQENRFKNWHTLLNATQGNKEQTQFKVPVGDDVHEINFAVPKEYRDLLSREMAKYATMHNIPATKEGIAALDDFAQRSIMWKYGTEIMATLFRDVQATTKDQILGKVHNIEITPTGTGGNKAPIPSKKTPMQEAISKIAKEGMNGAWK